MALFYSNIPLTKEKPIETILQMYITEEGTFTIIDKTTFTYHNETKFYRDIKFVKKGNNEYQIQLHPQANNDGVIIGLYLSEGTDVKVRTLKGNEPIFYMTQPKIQMDLKKFFNENEAIEMNVVGVFHPGTEISYKINGVPYVDKFTKDGWISKRKVKSVSDVAEASRKETSSDDELEKAKELVKIAEELKNSGEISQDLFERYKILRLGYDGKLSGNGLVLNTITLDEMELLKSKGL